MAKVLSKNRREKIVAAIYEKADEFGYATSGRIESGRFLDQLVEDPEIGGVLKEYYNKERVRTYIKDGVLNAYKKKLKYDTLAIYTPEAVIKSTYGCTAAVIQKGKGSDNSITVLRSEDGNIYVVSQGTVLKWETALRKALEIIAREPGLSVNGHTPSISLLLASVNGTLTEADKQHIFIALEAINVKAVICGE